MNINFKQVLGWILILIGLVIIFWAISSSYYYFTAEKEFPQLFVQEKTEKASSSGSGILNPQDLINQALQEQVGQLIPADAITLSLNMLAWIIFATFLVYAGAKVAGLGHEFLRG